MCSRIFLVTCHLSLVTTSYHPPGLNSLLIGYNVCQVTKSHPFARLQFWFHEKVRVQM